MRPMILLLAAIALIGAAPPRPPAHYEASGFEPSWVLNVDGSRMILHSGTSDPAITVVSPRWRAVRNGYRYSSSRMIVDVRHVRCEAYGSGIYPDTVLVTAYGRVGDGCGGIAIPPPSLAYSGWSVRAIGNDRLADNDQYRLEFREHGQLTGRAGCNEFTGTYREHRPFLTLAIRAVTRTDCLEHNDARERRALAILHDPLRMRFVEGDHLILTGPGGSLRMQQ